MAMTKRFERTLPFSGTQEQYDLVEDEANSRAISMAQVLREIVDAHYDSEKS